MLLRCERVWPIMTYCDVFRTRIQGKIQTAQIKHSCEEKHFVVVIKDDQTNDVKNNDTYRSPVVSQKSMCNLTFSHIVYQNSKIQWSQTKTSKSHYNMSEKVHFTVVHTLTAFLESFTCLSHNTNSLHNINGLNFVATFHWNIFHEFIYQHSVCNSVEKLIGMSHIM